jgi:hypothetical protein
MSPARKFKTVYDVKSSRLDHPDSITPTPGNGLGEDGQHLIVTQSTEESREPISHGLTAIASKVRAR